MKFKRYLAFMCIVAFLMGLLSLPASCVPANFIHDTFGPTPPSYATYSSGIAPGDGNANSLVGTSWINASLSKFVTNNIGTDFMKSGQPILQGREVCADTQGIVTYNLNFSVPVTLKLNVIGNNSLYGVMVKTDNWYFKSKWDRAYVLSPNTNAVLNPLSSYQSQDPGVNDVAFTKYYVYRNSNGHNVVVTKDPDGLWRLPTDYFNHRVLNPSVPADLAIINACEPVFKIEQSMDGSSWSDIGYSFSTNGVCVNTGLDEWQAATISADVSAGAQKVRITINAPSMFSFENPNDIIYGKPRWMNHGIWLSDAVIPADPAPSSVGIIPQRAYAERIGVTHVDGKYNLSGVSGVNYTTYSNEPYLLQGADILQDSGISTMKVWFESNPAGKYPFNSSWPASINTLTDLAQTTYYSQIFSKPNIKTYFLEFNPIANPANFGVAFTQSYKDSLKQEIENVASYLLETYQGTGKTFVFQNWEGDWYFSGTYDAGSTNFNDPVRIQNAIDYLNTVQDGISSARGSVNQMIADNVFVYGCAEVNRLDNGLIPGYTNDKVIMNGTSVATPRFIDTAIPYTHMDLYSYSNYQTGVDKVKLKAYIDYYKTKAADSIAFGNDNIVLGEFGYPENGNNNGVGGSSGEYYVQRLVQLQTETMINEENAPYVLYWQLFCNEFRTDIANQGGKSNPGIADMNGFWLIRPDGSKTSAYWWIVDYIASNSGNAQLLTGRTINGYAKAFMCTTVKNSSDTAGDPYWEIKGLSWSLINNGVGFPINSRIAPKSYINGATLLMRRDGRNSFELQYYSQTNNLTTLPSSIKINYIASNGTTVIVTGAACTITKIGQITAYNESNKIYYLYKVIPNSTITNSNIAYIQIYCKSITYSAFQLRDFYIVDR